MSSKGKEKLGGLAHSHHHGWNDLLEFSINENLIMIYMKKRRWEIKRLGISINGRLIKFTTPLRQNLSFWTTIECQNRNSSIKKYFLIHAFKSHDLFIYFDVTRFKCKLNQQQLTTNIRHRSMSSGVEMNALSKKRGNFTEKYTSPRATWNGYT
jgi:hypothetical protein